MIAQAGQKAPFALLPPTTSAVEPSHLEKIIRELGISPKEAGFVGDRTADVEAGRKAGMRTVAVSWGDQRREELQEAEPDFLLDP